MDAETILPWWRERYTGTPIRPTILTEQQHDELRDRLITGGAGEVFRRKFLLWLVGREPQTIMRRLDIDTCNHWLKEPLAGVHCLIFPHTDGIDRLWEVTPGVMRERQKDSLVWLA